LALKKKKHEVRHTRSSEKFITSVGYITERRLSNDFLSSSPKLLTKFPSDIVESKFINERFRNFCREVQSLDSIDFVLAATKFKKFPQFTEAMSIYDKFIDHQGRLSININETTRQKIKNDLTVYNINPNIILGEIFDDARLEICKLLDPIIRSYKKKYNESFVSFSFMI